MTMSIERKIERFDSRYRENGGFAGFMEMVENLATLEQIGKHFGFSRQNAAGLYKSFFDKGYGEVHRKRRIKRQMELFSTCCDLDDIQTKLKKRGKYRSARKVGYIRMVRKLAEALKYEVLIRQKRSGALEMFINGHKCAISGSKTQTVYHIPKNHPPSVYYRFAVPVKKVDFCTFVLELEDHYTFYIIPYMEIKHLTLITLKDNYIKEKGRRGNTSSKYAIYRNRWDFMKKPNPNPEYKAEIGQLEQSLKN